MYKNYIFLPILNIRFTNNNLYIIFSFKFDPAQVAHLRVLNDNQTVDIIKQFK